MSTRNPETVAAAKKAVQNVQTSLQLIVAEAERARQAADEALAERDAFFAAPIPPGTTAEEHVARMQAAMDKAERTGREAKERFEKAAAAIAAASPAGTRQ